MTACCWYAPDHVYGSPDDLKTLIDEAHLRGLMVFLDVVYNHFGPEGNYLGRYAPTSSAIAQTPWGAAIDYSRAEVRAFAVENALHWLDDYRFDGLRLDAVHAIAEPGGLVLLDEISRAVGALARDSGRLDPPRARERRQSRSACSIPQRRSGRQVSRPMERRLSPRLARVPDRRNPRLLRRLCARRRHVQSRGRCVPASSIRANRRRIAAARKRGEPSGQLPPAAFVNFLQNHDQIGNRALGDRLEWSADRAAHRGRARDHPARADAADAVHGRGMWRAHAVSVLLRLSAARSPTRSAKAAAREFAQAYESFGKDVPDPLSPSDLQVREARLARSRWRRSRPPRAGQTAA